jgi:hypothetical protein
MPRRNNQTKVRPNRRRRNANNNNNSRFNSRVDLSMSPRPTFVRGTQVVPLRLRGVISSAISSAAGVLNFVQNINITQALNNAQLINLFDEYRIVKAQVEYIPFAQYALANVSATYVDALSMVDYDSSAALTSYSVAWNFDTTKHFALDERSVITIRPLGQPDLAWTSVGTGVDVAWYKVFASGLSNGTTYGRFYLTMWAQFRGIF